MRSVAVPLLGDSPDAQWIFPFTNTSETQPHACSEPGGDFRVDSLFALALFPGTLDPVAAIILPRLGPSIFRYGGLDFSKLSSGKIPALGFDIDHRY